MPQIGSAQNDELDKRLEKLALQAQQQPSGSQERRKALIKLIEEIQQQSYRLMRPQKSNYSYPSQLCQEIFDIAYQRLMLYLYRSAKSLDRNIEGYKPERGTVINWLNVKLDRRFFQAAYSEIKCKFSERNPELVKKSAVSLRGDENNGKENSDIPDKKQERTGSQLIRDCIEEDPKGVFAKKHVKNQPDATFQKIALLHCDGYTWSEIASILEIKAHSTVHSFYTNCVREFKHIFQEYLS